MPSEQCPSPHKAASALWPFPHEIPRSSASLDPFSPSFKITNKQKSADFGRTKEEFFLYFQLLLVLGLENV